MKNYVLTKLCCGVLFTLLATFSLTSFTNSAKAADCTTGSPANIGSTSLCAGPNSWSNYRSNTVGFNSYAGNFSDTVGNGAQAIDNNSYNDILNSNGYGLAISPIGSYQSHQYATYRQNDVYGYEVSDNVSDDYFVASRDSSNGTTGQQFYANNLSSWYGGGSLYSPSSLGAAYQSVVYGSVANGENALAVKGSTAIGQDTVAIDYSSATGTAAYASEASVANGYYANAINGSTATGYFAYSDYFSVANGFASFAQNNSVAVGAFSQASGSFSTALGSNSSALATNSVALGYGSVADRANTVSVGAPGAERQITNVAAGTQGTDAVNVNQLNQSISRIDSKLSSGVAMAMAMGGGSYIEPGKTNAFTMAVGAFSDQQAVAASYTRAIGPNTVVNAALSYGSGGGSSGNSGQVGGRLSTTLSW
jgi:autotransporter adhesin